MSASGKERVGFVGLGNMGRGMAKNLVTKGFPLTVMAHRNREPVESLKALGAAEAVDARDLAERSDIVVLCVTGSPEVEAVIHGPRGLASAGKPLLILDASTSDPSQTLKLAAQLAPHGITLLDTPLGRTPKEAEAGMLDVLIGAEDAGFARAEPVLKAFAGRVLRTGPVGSGHTMKLLMNFLSMGLAAMYSEAIVLGEKGGITPEVFNSVISGGRMDCGFYQTFMKWTLEKDPEAHRFAIRNGFKDVGYLAGFANSVGLINPVGAAVRNVFASAVGAGDGDKFVPMLIDSVRAANGK